jgi:hypothetical protein
MRLKWQGGFAASARAIQLSPSVTTLTFNLVLPLLQVPISAGEEDDSSSKRPYIASRMKRAKDL